MVFSRYCSWQKSTRLVCFQHQDSNDHKFHSRFDTEICELVASTMNCRNAAQHPHFALKQPASSKGGTPIHLLQHNTCLFVASFRVIHLQTIIAQSIVIVVCAQKRTTQGLRDPRHCNNAPPKAYTIAASNWESDQKHCCCKLRLQVCLWIWRRCQKKVSEK